tara:strand:- start:188 stop:2461 length:2274 start_codon:yes stop_codon:yes gene_type:complete
MSVLTITIPTLGNSQTDPEEPQLSIQTQSYFHNPETGTYLYRNAKVEWEGITVESTEINYHPREHRLTAWGYVRVTEGSIVAVMDELEINLKNGNGTFRNTIIFDASNKAYMTASEVKRIGEKHFVAQNCSFTTCDPKSPAWQITGSEVNYYSQNFSSSQRTFLKIGNFPIFYFPYLAWPTVKRRQSGFLPPEYMIVRSSVRKLDLGYRIGIPYFWAIDPEQDLTLTYDWVERRGPGLRLDYQYAFIKGMRGGIKYQEFFERDSRDPENESGSLSPEEIDSHELNPKRYKFEFNHNQQIDEQSRLIASALVYSDSQFQKEYELVEKPNPIISQNVSANINRQFTKGSISLSANQNREFGEIALLNKNIYAGPINFPVISFQFSEVFWRSGKTTLSRAISGNAIHWYTNQGSSGEEITVSPNLGLGFAVFRHFDANLSITEKFSRNRTRDPDVPGSEEDNKFQIFSGNAQISTTISRIFSRPTGIYTSLKHLVVPSLKYDYIEDVELGDQATRRLTTFSLNNTLLAKRRNFEKRDFFSSKSKTLNKSSQVKSSKLASLNFIQHYDNLKKNPSFQPIGPGVKGSETEPGQPLLPLRTNINYTPGSNFSVSYFNRYHHQRRQIVEYSTKVNFSASEHNNSSVSLRKNEYSYQTPFGTNVDASHTFGFSNKFETSDKLAFGITGTMNLNPDSTAFRRRLTSNSFTLDYRPNCWNIRLALTENVDKTTTSNGLEKEYIDRTLYAYINLGGVEIPEQIQPNLD